MSILDQTFSAFSADTLEDLLACIRRYLMNTDNRGQFDRAQGYTNDEVQTRAGTLLCDYVGSQERKWNEVGPLITNTWPVNQSAFWMSTAALATLH